jgi:transcriptional regulator with XRE-family HTH domain
VSGVDVEGDGPGSAAAPGGREEETDGAGSYTREVGERLRRVRVAKGWSLQDVERESEGRWKAAVVGSYERGDRNISATRLLELAAYYGVSPVDVLPGDAAAGAPPTGAVVMDLERLDGAGERFAPIRRYLETIQVQRGDYNRRVLSVRGEDLRALAVLAETSPDELVAELRAEGVIAN